MQEVPKPYLSRSQLYHERTFGFVQSLVQAEHFSTRGLGARPPPRFVVQHPTCPSILLAEPSRYPFCLAWGGPGHVLGLSTLRPILPVQAWMAAHDYGGPVHTCRLRFA